MNKVTGSSSQNLVNSSGDNSKVKNPKVKAAVKDVFSPPAPRLPSGPQSLISSFNLNDIEDDSDASRPVVKTPVKKPKSSTSGLTPDFSLVRVKPEHKEAEEDQENSPLSSPRHKVKKQPLPLSFSSSSKLKTPPRVRSLVQTVAKMTPDRSAVRSEQEQLEKGLKALDQLPSPQRRDKTAQITSIIKDRIGNNNNSNCIALPKDAYEDFGCSWPKDVIQSLREGDEVPFRVLNIDHLLQAEIVKNKLVGFHFCPKGDPKRANIKILQLHPVTGVMYGEHGVPDPKDSKKLLVKKSTFFPDAIKSVEELVSLIETSQRLEAEENRAIFKHPKYPFFMEAYLREEGLCIHSIFPLFEYATYTPNKAMLIGGQEIPAAAILEAGLKAIKVKGNEKYHLEEEVIVDIGFAFPPLETGVYIKFPIEVLSSKEKLVHIKA